MEQRYDTKRAVGTLYAMDAFIQFGEEIAAAFAHFVELPNLLREYIERLNKRAEGDDAGAMYSLGSNYFHGGKGLTQDYEKGMELYLRAGKLGYATAYCNIGFAYQEGKGVERDEAKAKYYWELGAMGGDVPSRHNIGMLEALGALENSSGSMSRALKHFMIAAGAGCDESLTGIRECFLNGHATKDDFEKALRAHKEAADEKKSDQRDAAAAFRANQRGGD